MEIGGSCHYVLHKLANDQARTSALQTLGTRESRLWNREVLGNLEGVLETIWNKLHNEQEKP